MFEDVLVIHHGGCSDGTCAAWCAYRFYLEATERGDAEVVFFAALHGQEPPFDLIKKAHKTFILDFSYPREVMLEISKLTELKVIDHHIKAQEDCVGLDFCEFDMSRSGAGMAWDYFFPNQDRPWLVDYIETRDIWEWKWPNAGKVLAYVDTLPMDFSSYDKMFEGKITFAECVEKGGAVEAYIDNSIKETIDKGLRHITFRAPDGTIYVDIPVINSSEKQVSKLVSSFAKDHLFGLSYFRRNDGKYQYSIRVPEDSSFDSNALAKLYGGGGHKKAAGFHIYRELGELTTNDGECLGYSWNGTKILGCGRKIKGREIIPRE